MGNNDLISIITASYNYAEYISETIESVIRQSYANWEMIIVDDGSTDNSVEIIKNYVQKDDRIRLYTHENNVNKGLAETINLGISKAQGEYIVFLESDDYIRNDYLEKKVAIAKQNSQYGFICNKVKLIGASEVNNGIKQYVKKMNKFWDKGPKQNEIINNFWFWNIIPTFSCVMVKTELLKTCNFSSPQRAWLDWWLWSQICDKTDFYFIKEDLTFWRIHTDSYINRNKNITNYEWKTKAFYKDLYNMIDKKRIPFIRRIKIEIVRMLRIIKYTLFGLIKDLRNENIYLKMRLLLHKIIKNISVRNKKNRTRRTKDTCH